MSYPSSMDGLPDVSPGDLIDATHENAQTAAINAIESTLGVTPAGPYSTVADAIAAKGDRNYATDSGSTNALAVTLSPAPSSYTAGLEVSVKVANSITGAATINVNSLGAKSIKKQGTTALESGDIAAGQIVDLVYDGSNFQMIGTARVSPTYTGQSSISTVGTISSGTWQGTAVNTSYGGTGASTPSGARSNLGLAIGSDVQAYNSTLAAVAAGTYAGATSITTLGSIATGTWLATAIGAQYGGTGQTSVSLGDLLYGSASNVWSRLSGNTTTTRKFLRQTGNGSSSAAPSWDTLQAGDIPAIAESGVTNLVSDLAAKVPTSRTVNGHALSSDVTVTAADLSLDSLIVMTGGDGPVTSGYVSDSTHTVTWGDLVSGFYAYTNSSGRTKTILLTVNARISSNSTTANAFFRVFATGTGVTVATYSRAEWANNLEVPTSFNALVTVTNGNTATFAIQDTLGTSSIAYINQVTAYSTWTWTAVIVG